MKKKYINKVNLVVLLIGLLFSLKGFSYSSEENCPRLLTHVDNLQFLRNYQDDISECWISIDNMNGYQNFIYRSYLVTSDGMLMVFNSYGEGPNSTHTGARVFYFFPREPFLNQTEVQKNLVSVQINSQLKFQFNTQELSLINQENFKVKTDAKISPKNKGGVEILKYNGVYLDGGFSLGRSPLENPESVSKFTNSRGQICRIKNKFIFDYKNDDIYIHGDEVLKEDVHLACPDFIWNL
ncbi:MAG: hypothetical protein KDD45_05485 [Bdellovibrionales bacterium]|nr:hypothetical protein [Bdellovibrionales bacterium]